VIDHVPAPLLGGVGLLERAIDYTLGSLQGVAPQAMSRPTPCRAWDLRALLDHLDESLLALHEAAHGHVPLTPADPSASADPVAVVRERAGRLLGAWTAAGRSQVTIGDTALTTGLLTSAGAIEIAVHGWDVSQAVGRHHPLPPALAEELLALTPFLVSDLDRPARFATPVAVPPGSPAGERLLALLGRRPQ